jgi:hypothetical protein
MKYDCFLSCFLFFVISCESPFSQKNSKKVVGRYFMDLPALLILDMVKDNFKEEGYWLPKPRFSAFFNTDLETWLHDRKVTLCVVGHTVLCPDHRPGCSLPRFQGRTTGRLFSGILFRSASTNPEHLPPKSALSAFPGHDLPGTNGSSHPVTNPNSSEPSIDFAP